MIANAVCHIIIHICHIIIQAYQMRLMIANAVCHIIIHICHIIIQAYQMRLMIANAVLALFGLLLSAGVLSLTLTRECVLLLENVFFY